MGAKLESDLMASDATVAILFAIILPKIPSRTLTEAYFLQPINKL